MGKIKANTGIYNIGFAKICGSSLRGSSSHLFLNPPAFKVSI